MAKDRVQTHARRAEILYTETAECCFRPYSAKTWCCVAYLQLSVFDAINRHRPRNKMPETVGVACCALPLSGLVP
eukprot:51109-Eustigmatos_ZCMA.PRE.1